MKTTPGNGLSGSPIVGVRRLSAALLAITVLTLTLSCRKTSEAVAPARVEAQAQTFLVLGVIKELKPAEQAIVIRHEAITNYMPAMSMTFAVRDTNQLADLGAGDQITFTLFVTETESWIANIAKTGVTAPQLAPPSEPTTNSQATLSDPHPLMSYQFTNELGQLVSFNDFKGRAIALTFIFTRCPLPEYCPRLMKNFTQAAAKLRARPDAPTNWHFLTITFDPAVDTPAVLRAYAQQYQYDPNQWSFLTGSPARIAELAEAVGVYYEADGAFFNHNFRTLVIDAAGQLQMSFPIGGDLSDILVAEIFKAAAVTNR